jgi:thiol-disulfide isomerase/thioredoxin
MTRREFVLRVAALSPSLAAISARTVVQTEGQELIGTAAPPLHLKDWLNSKPLEISDLRGEVALLRWWTEGCPYCAATAPALISLQQTYGSQGLQIIGVFHPKPPGKWTLQEVRRAAEERHFTFPIAVDGNWTALNRWWLTSHRDFTSVSFLLDQKGIIRYIHPGGEFHDGEQGGMPTHEACNREMHFIQREIAKLLNV